MTKQTKPETPGNALALLSVAVGMCLFPLLGWIVGYHWAVDEFPSVATGVYSAIMAGATSAFVIGARAAWKGRSDSQTPLIFQSLFLTLFLTLFGAFVVHTLCLPVLLAWWACDKYLQLDIITPVAEMPLIPFYSNADNHGVHVVFTLAGVISPIVVSFAGLLLRLRR